MKAKNICPARSVLYLRMASPRQADQEAAIARQRLACEQRAAELNTEVVDEYVDVGSSGVSAERPELRRMLAELKDRRNITEEDVLYVIAYDHARIARDMYVYADVVWRIEAAGARLEIATAWQPGQPKAGSPSAHIADISERQHNAIHANRREVDG